MNNKLDEIVAVKREEVARKKSVVPFSEVIERAAAVAPTEDLFERLSNHEPAEILCIAEIKRASPSKGIITKDFSPEKIAREYKLGGAAALSVLTDERFFMGHNDYLAAVKAKSTLPVLRKDFIIDEYQIFESRMIGADAILLIVSILSDQQLRSFMTTANDLSLSVLVECHSKSEIDRALLAGATIIGINNRDLTTFMVDVGVSLKLKNFIPNECISVSESGIRNHHTVQQLAQAGFDAILVGEQLMSQTNRAQAIRDLLGTGAAV
jgi:indole-3-glycerol phosphate synthase